MPPHPVFRSGATALITGGASGIGLAVARLCSKHGMKLALVDNNAQSLSKAKASLTESAEQDVETYDMDVSKIEEWADVREEVEKRFGGVDLLMLNAGVEAKGGWEDVQYFHKILDTNLYGIIHGLSTFLPLIQRSPSPTSVIITGSKQGITNPPGNAAYNASKAAVKALAEHLSYDLRSTSTSVHLLIPGWTYIGLTGGGEAKEKPAGAWAPEQVAGFLEEKMAQRVFYVLCPDNEVSVDTDRRRVLWAAGDVVEERPPLSRWREEWKERAVERMRGMKGAGLDGS
ncbi:hypothetical protein MMC13_002353 [Lambiella insularis]|nr:hypothetical protein [Lambiella insularis]